MATEKIRPSAQFAQWPGSLLDGLFRLDQLLGESASAAVFRTDFSRRKAAVKIFPSSEADARLLRNWQAAAKLNHPHLARILASGKASVHDTPVVYIATEYADETMAHVLAERLLTPTEARDILVTALETLAYLHSGGFAHGHVTASNFLAVGDKLKLSVDGVAPASPAEQAGDVLMLGELFQSALPQPLPQPFLDITRHAADANPATRWTLAEIATRLDGRMPERSAPPQPPVWKFVLPLAAILVAAIIFMLARSVRRPASEPAPAPAPVVAQTAPPPATPATQAPPPAPSKPETPRERRRRLKAEKAAKAAEEKAARAAAQKSAPQTTPTQAFTADASGNPLPDVPSYATRTIHGKVIIPVRVDVDPSGKVTGAKLDGPSSSPYFAGFALKAARQWKFTPSGSPDAFLLRFTFTRENTQVSSAHLGR